MDLVLKQFLLNLQRIYYAFINFSLSQEKIYTDIFDYNNEAEMDHISLSRWADIVLIVSCNSKYISKLSNGIADDLLLQLF